MISPPQSNWIGSTNPSFSTESNGGLRAMIIFNKWLCPLCSGKSLFLFGCLLWAAWFLHWDLFFLLQGFDFSVFWGSSSPGLRLHLMIWGNVYFSAVSLPIAGCHLKETLAWGCNRWSHSAGECWEYLFFLLHLPLPSLLRQIWGEFESPSRKKLSLLSVQAEDTFPTLEIRACSVILRLTSSEIT